MTPTTRRNLALHARASRLLATCRVALTGAWKSGTKMREALR